MRVTLPDRPGSLGSVATAMGSVDADINAVEIVEKKSDGSVVDDFIVDLPPNQLPETIVTACQSLPGVRVEWIARYPEGGGLQSDLEALERMTADPPHAAETLVSLCPVVFRSHWATLIDVSVVGAMVVSPTSLKPNQRVRMSLPDPTRPIRFGAGVAWSAFEIPKAGPRYRAGIEFFDADPPVMEQFIEGKKAGEKKTAEKKVAEKKTEKKK